METMGILMEILMIPPINLFILVYHTSILCNEVWVYVDFKNKNILCQNYRRLNISREELGNMQIYCYSLNQYFFVHDEISTNDTRNVAVCHKKRTIMD